MELVRALEVEVEVHAPALGVALISRLGIRPATGTSSLRHAQITVMRHLLAQSSLRFHWPSPSVAGADVARHNILTYMR